jgi:hypothetical protein
VDVAQLELLLATLEEALLEELLLATLDELDLLDELLATLDLLEELLAVAVGPTEHHALSVKLFDGNSEVLQVKLPVSVA